jgi:hypothetical protein
MARVRDLTEIINARCTKSYLGEALSMNWSWARYERDEADALSPRLRSLSRQAETARYGVRMLAIED